MARNYHMAKNDFKLGEDGVGKNVYFYSDVSGTYTKFDKTTGAFSIGASVIQGTSSASISSSTADTKFNSSYCTSSATSGDNRLTYNKFTLSGTIAATGYGDCARNWSNVTGTGYSYVSGCHNTVSIAVGGTITGSSSGTRTTFGAAAASRTIAGKHAALHLCSDIGTGNTVTTASFMRVTDDGAVRIANMMQIPVAANGTIFAAHTTQTLTHSIKIIDEAGTAYYIMCTDAATNRS